MEELFAVRHPGSQNGDPVQLKDLTVPSALRATMTRPPSRSWTFRRLIWFVILGLQICGGTRWARAGPITFQFTGHVTSYEFFSTDPSNHTIAPGMVFSWTFMFS